jgi:hypothetical protein
MMGAATSPIVTWRAAAQILAADFCRLQQWRLPESLRRSAVAVGIFTHVESSIRLKHPPK